MIRRTIVAQIRLGEWDEKLQDPGRPDLIIVRVIFGSLRQISFRYGVVANIIASHAIARGSIPRVGMLGL